MKKLFTSCFIITSLALSPALKAEDLEEPDEGGTPVGQASNEGTRAAKKKRWQNYAIAAGAVAIAVTALILVANNDGHESSK
jgi:hypothetical protein